MTYRFIDDLFPTEEELTFYHSHPFPFNLPLVKERLDKKLEEDPDYEVFLPFYYQKLERFLKDDTSLKVVNPSYLFISNLGKIISNNNKEKKFREIPTKPYMGEGYIVALIAIAGKAHTLAVHRALGCVFLPVPDKFKAIHPKFLEINHLDGVKQNMALSNLEWTDSEGNQKHALITKLRGTGEAHSNTKPLKGEVVRGKFTGYSFIIFGKTQLVGYGFDQAAVSNAANGNLMSHGNCKWSFATQEEVTDLPREIPEDVLADIRTICPIAKSKIVGTNLETGEIVEFIGDKAIKEAGFLPSGVRNVLSGITKTHKGYSWKKVDLEY